MRRRLLALTLILACWGTLAAAEVEIRLREPWESEYTGEDATGDHVIALWGFQPGAEMDDASGHGHDLVLEDAKINSEGLFGSCLESFPGWPVEDQRHRATAKDQDDLSPPGPFTLELWIKPKPELATDYPDAFLLDKKYVADDDYQLIVGAPDRYGSRMLRACLGFGRDSSTWHSRPARFEPGAWSHVGFTYDGAGVFFDPRAASCRHAQTTGCRLAGSGFVDPRVVH